MKQSIIFTALLAASVVFTGCEKWLDVGDPKNAVETSVIFQDEAGLQAAIAGMYNSGNAIELGRLSLYNSLQADDLSANVTGYDPYKNNSLVSNEATVGTIWSSLYIGIYRANDIIEGVPKSAGLSDAIKNQSIGEALFLRGLYYFYLVNLYADVPLVTGTDLKKNELLPRTASSVVYSQIITDLEKAASLLPTAYPGGSDRVRANKWAATALLARVNLYLGKYAEAERLSTAVIEQTGVYILSEDLNTVFVKRGTDAIFAFDVSHAGYTTVGLNAIPAAGSVPSLIIHPSLFSLFAPNDARKANWIGTSAGQPFSYKYKVRSGIGNEYDVALRISEQYLIRAEARVYLKDLDGAAADVNKIRKRAKVNDIEMNSEEEALVLIANERRMEYFSEWSHRWFDLKRTNLVGKVIGELKPQFWQDTDALFPIPSRERQMNTNLTQNEGYD
ncbi:RagB/SusD family nutrient uptake outer membrane protein [Pedobacter nyackensis]|uniref:RagB/SusD family nutrient uptake outer membrane protein n=1 Tax=Pedobacter nyackensis TaxID=475255 RepID=UPI00292CCB0B|nr:RagB/SusD family nutrient uptake outer membrane protein [Pedobacter nyackensis]